MKTTKIILGLALVFSIYSCIKDDNSFVSAEDAKTSAKIDAMNDDVSSLVEEQEANTYSNAISGKVADAAFSDCNLTKVTGGQLSDTVKIYLKNNPEVRQYGASSLVEKIVKEKYNCK